MKIGTEIVEVEPLPHSHDNIAFAIPAELGNVETSLDLPDGGHLVALSGSSGNIACLARISAEEVVEYSSCYSEASDLSTPEGQSPIVQPIGTFLVVANLSSDIAVVKYGNAYRQVEHGVTYFAGTDSRNLQYFGGDGVERVLEEVAG